ncbi:hypothetical protein WJX72_003192 [[Myrmecia] bisecta]|uniref:Uncharacterized protein n=1 Tax=[Myrmecia] bisecta TaxID=41462 RepID=A0AAW1QPU0_9CHLO
MTSLALAPDLPSEDEEDEDFDPTKEADGSGDEKAKKAAGVKRSRGTFGRPVDSAGKHRGTEADEDPFARRSASQIIGRG